MYILCTTLSRLKMLLVLSCWAPSRASLQLFAFFAGTTGTKIGRQVCLCEPCLIPTALWKAPGLSPLSMIVIPLCLSISVFASVSPSPSLSYTTFCHHRSVWVNEKWNRNDCCSHGTDRSEEKIQGPTAPWWMIASSCNSENQPGCMNWKREKDPQEAPRFIYIEAGPPLPCFPALPPHGISLSISDWFLYSLEWEIILKHRLS